MTFSYPDITEVFQTDERYVNSLVIENKTLFSEIVQDIYGQTEGNAGMAVLSDGEKLLDFAKFADLITTFVPFSVNRKTLLGKIVSAMEKEAQKAELYESTMQFLADAEKYFDTLTVDFSCDLEYNKLNLSVLLRAIGVEVRDDSACIAEKMLNYMELVREFDRDRLFIAVNMRGYVGDAETERFLSSVLSHKFHFLMLESAAYPLLSCERRVTVDEDLCEF